MWFSKIADWLYLSERNRLKKQFKAADAKEFLKLRYDLKPDSIVFDVGGYRGNWASDIFSMYGCKIYVFEPVPDFAKLIRNRFVRNPSIVLINKALGSSSGFGSINLNADGTSFVRRGKEKIRVPLIDIKEFIESQKIDFIDLIKINIEGGEYDLLERIIDIGLLKRFGNLQIQFHNIDKNSQPRMINIQNNLCKTHHLTYQYKFVWENWAINR